MQCGKLIIFSRHSNEIPSCWTIDFQFDFVRLYQILRAASFKVIHVIKAFNMIKINYVIST